MDICVSCRSLRRLGIFIAIVIFCASVLAANGPKVGSSNTVTPEPPIARPHTKPCVVQLFTNLSFTDFNDKSFQYSANCTGPWAMVIFEADFDVTAGRQYDRTANVWIGGTNVYYGTAAEPSKTVSPRWRVERDVTEYAPLFTSAQPGIVSLGNLVNETYTGVIHGSARLLFYPAEPGTKPPLTADVVLPLSAGSTGGAVSLASPKSALTKTFTLPRNVERAYLDVYPKSQAKDEFWYTCVPGEEMAKKFDTCNASTFREVDVTIDGQPAGVAPVYPWIYTGGMDPYLWRPMPAVQTLNFEPYRVDLTPFAGVLSNGEPHTLSVTVFNAGDYFAVTATLVLYLDHGSAQVTGEVTTNTIGQAAPAAVTNSISEKDGRAEGTVATRASRRFEIAGYVNTSHGKVATEVVQSIDFVNDQKLLVSPEKSVQDIKQTTVINSATTTQEGENSSAVYRQAHWPLLVAVTTNYNQDKSFAQTTKVRQTYTVQENATRNGVPARLSSVSNEITSEDTVQFDANNKRTGNSGQSSSAKYFYADSDGACYSRTLTSSGGKLTSVQDACGSK